MIYVGVSGRYETQNVYVGDDREAAVDAVEIQGDEGSVETWLDGHLLESEDIAGPVHESGPPIPGSFDGCDLPSESGPTYTRSAEPERVAGDTLALGLDPDRDPRPPVRR